MGEKERERKKRYIDIDMYVERKKEENRNKITKMTALNNASSGSESGKNFTNQKIFKTLLKIVTASKFHVTGKQRVI